MTDVFSRLAPYIQDYIYANRWTELRDIQTAACQVIFETDDNLSVSYTHLDVYKRQRLQIIVEKLEKGEESLEESMKLFEEGAKLSADCYGILTKAEQKITEFSKIEKQTEEQDEE